MHVLYAVFWYISHQREAAKSTNGIRADEAAVEWKKEVNVLSGQNLDPGVSYTENDFYEKNRTAIKMRYRAARLQMQNISYIISTIEKGSGKGK